MNTKKAEIPRENIKDDHYNSAQLHSIIQKTAKWMDLLFHDFNGLLGNVNWVTSIMVDDASGLVLSKDVFKELNLTTLGNISTLKLVQQYIRVLLALADKDLSKFDTEELNQATLTAIIPKLERLKSVYTGEPFNVTPAFIRVISFLIHKFIRLLENFDTTDNQLTVKLSGPDSGKVFIKITAPSLFLRYDFWEPVTGKDDALRFTEPFEIEKRMFFELLTLVGGRMLLDNEKESSSMQQTECVTGYASLVFSVPLNLEEF